MKSIYVQALVIHNTDVKLSVGFSLATSLSALLEALHLLWCLRLLEHVLNLLLQCSVAEERKKSNSKFATYTVMTIDTASLSGGSSMTPGPKTV